MLALCTWRISPYSGIAKTEVSLRVQFDVEYYLLNELQTTVSVLCLSTGH